MIPYHEGDEEPEIPPILMDPWDSGYDQNEIRRDETTSRLDTFWEDSNTETESLPLQSIFLKPTPQTIKRINRPYEDYHSSDPDSELN